MRQIDNWVAVFARERISTLRTVKEFGLTGGIGSGKSTVSAMFADRGANIIDADAIVRELQVPGERVFDMMVDRWGSTIVQPNGTLDRGRVADIVFNNQSELDALNALVHPVVAVETEARIDQHRGTDAIVIHDIALLVVPGGELLTTRNLADWSGIIVVDTAPEIAVARVVQTRGLSGAEVRARQARQASREERLAVADFVIDNNLGIDELSTEVDRSWDWMLAGGAGATSGEHNNGKPSTGEIA